jgi:hypothetical protein
MWFQYMSVLEFYHHKLGRLLQRLLEQPLLALQATQLLKLAQMRVI